MLDVQQLWRWCIAALAALGMSAVAMQAQQPSAEYIRLGGRLIAIEHPEASSIAITPSSFSVASGETLQFRAAITPSTDPQDVIWAVSPSSAGAISSTGLFTAATDLLENVTTDITAVSVADPTKTATIRGTVTIPALTCSLDPASATVPNGGGSVSVVVSCAPGVAWDSLTGAFSWASISPSSGVGNTTVVVAAGNQEGTSARTADLIIAGVPFGLTQTAPSSVTISPASVQLQHDQTQTFTGYVNGVVSYGLTWSLSGVGSLVGGVYTAPSVIQEGQPAAIVTAQDPVGNGVGTASIELAEYMPPSGLSITPSSGSQLTQSFTLSMDAHNSAIGAAMYVNFSTAFDQQASGCYAMIAGNDIQLKMDGSGWAYATLGTAGWLENAQCRIDLAQSSWTRSDTFVYATLRITFKPGFIGTKGIFMTGVTYENGVTTWSDWEQVGSWDLSANVQALPPNIGLDIPAEGADVQGDFLLQGWAIDNANQIENGIGGIEVLIDGQRLGDATLGVSRPDVCNVYPDRTGCPNVGFQFNWNTRTALNGPHTITLIAVDNDNPTHSTQLSRTVYVDNPPEPQLGISPSSPFVRIQCYVPNGWSSGCPVDEGPLPIEMQQFTASLGGAQVTDLNWSLQAPESGSGGSITPAGLYIAPAYLQASAGDHIILSTARQSDPSKTASTTITVMGILIGDDLILQPGQHAWYWEGVPLTDFSISPQIGTIDQTGYYVAPATLPADTVVMVSARETSDASARHVSYIRLMNEGSSTAERINAPLPPSGPANVIVGASHTYTATGASSTAGHSVQYQFSWGDGTTSAWLPVGTTSASHAWTAAGTYLVTVHARCATHNTILSFVSSALYVNAAVIEVISAPQPPTGPSAGLVGASYSFTASGGASNVGHAVQYRFEWGDGTSSGWLPIGTTMASHAWASAATYSVTALARCGTHTSVVSSASGPKQVVILETELISTPNAPTGPTTAAAGVASTYSVTGAVSNIGHAVQYKFDWGDGTDSGWLPTGSATAAHSWTNPGTYGVTARARCGTDTALLSATPSALNVRVVSGTPVTVTVPALADDALLEWKGTPGTWPPGAQATLVDSAATTPRVDYSVGTGGYTLYDNYLVRFDTSVIPDNARVVSAKLFYYVTSIEQVDGGANFRYRGEYYDSLSWPLQLHDWARYDAIGFNAIATPPLGALTVGWNSVEIANVQNVSNSAYTAFRLGAVRLDVIGQAPTGRNGAAISTASAATNKPYLLVTYTEPNQPGPAAAVDFNGNGVSDLVWQNDTTAAVTVDFYGTGPLYTGSASLSSTSGWQVASVIDHDRNGVPDLIWQESSTRRVTVNYYGGSTPTQLTGWAWLQTNSYMDWHVVGAGDFDGNGIPDLVWQNDTTRQVVVHYYGGENRTTYLGWASLSSSQPLPWRVRACADFDRNGVPDLVWQNDATNQVTVHHFGGTGGYQMINWAYLTPASEPGWHIVGATDFNQDGVPDLLWQNDALRRVTVNFYGGPNGSTMIGWAWLSSAGKPGWHVAFTSPEP